MQTSFCLIHLELTRQIRSYTPVVSFLKNHTRLQAKMSRVYTRSRTERGNTPIWPVCNECHSRPRALYRTIFSLDVLWLLQEGCHAITPSANLEWKHFEIPLGEGWKKTAIKFTFTLAALRRSVVVALKKEGQPLVPVSVGYMSAKLATGSLTFYDYFF